MALGLVNADSFAGLRVLLLPVDRRRRAGGARRPRSRVALFGMEDAGRWTLVHRGPRARTDEAAATGRNVQPAVEHVARVLLQRWGVVFWKVYQREAAWLPPWRELLMVYRRLEARGEIRGGRFVAGFSGEQYALPAAIGALRERRRRDRTATWVSISAADPLNVVGLLTPGAPRARAHPQSSAVSRRRAGRHPRRRRGDLPRAFRRRDAVGRPQPAVAPSDVAQDADRRLTPVRQSGRVRGACVESRA